jgi:glycosyltransferase involved in cell wall biosynthesis
MNTIAIVIPAYNESPSLPVTLASYRPLLTRFPGSRFVIVDNNSTDDTVAGALAFGRRTGTAVEIVPERRQGIKYARKTGLSASSDRADLLLSTDADTVITLGASDRLARTIRGFIASQADILTCEGTTDPDVVARRLALFPVWVYWKTRIWRLSVSLFGPYCLGSFFVVKADFYRRMLPVFDPERLPGEGSDIFFSHRAYYVGARFMRSKGSYVVTSPRRFLGDPYGWLVGRRRGDWREPDKPSRLASLAETKRYVDAHAEAVQDDLVSSTADQFWYYFDDAVRFAAAAGAGSPALTGVLSRFCTFFRLTAAPVPENAELLKRQYSAISGSRIAAYLMS